MKLIAVFESIKNCLKKIPKQKPIRVAVNGIKENNPLHFANIIIDNTNVNNLKIYEHSK